MKIFSRTFSAWLVLLAALFLWGCVAYLAWTVRHEQSSRSIMTQQEEDAALQIATDLKLRALARETEVERDALGEITDTSILEILDVVEKIADDARTSVNIGEVLGGGAPDAEQQFRSLSLAVEVSGSFQKVMQILGLLEALPIPSTVQSVHLERIVLESGNQSWRMVSRIRFFTTSDLST